MSSIATDSYPSPTLVGIRTRKSPALYLRAILARFPTLNLVMTSAISFSLVTLWVFFQAGVTNVYADGLARLLIARRIIDSPTAGLAQLGAVWPPLTHILSLPLIWNDFMYESGLALTVFSMLGYVLTTYFLYKTILTLTQDRWSSVIGSFIFMLNPNMLFMQATPMTELPMYACIMAATYYLVRMAQTPHHRLYMLGCGIALALGALVRYEVWIIALIYIPSLIYILLRQRMNLVQIEGTLIYWGFWAFAGAAAWMLWNWLIFGDPLNFQRGEYAAPALWVSSEDAVFRNLPISFLSYSYATLSTIGPMSLLAPVALVAYLWKTRLRPDSIPILALVALFPAFVAMLYLGQRPLQVPEVTGVMYNIRFALVMALPIAIIFAFLTRGSWWAKLALILVFSVSLIFQVRTNGIITLSDPVSYRDEPLAIAANEARDWLLTNYDQRPLMMESYGNTPIQFEARLPLEIVIYEGSYRLWEAAIADPARYIDWVLMRYREEEGSTGLSGDLLFRELRDQASFRQDFELNLPEFLLRNLPQTRRASCSIAPVSMAQRTR
jgi:4-amino-4-deoxy-L-arabinose transferase-like glycosyltransferase